MEANCIIHYQFGSPKDVLNVENKTIEPLKDNEVLVRMLARPINPSDLIPIKGFYSHRISLPNIPGYEGVGIVEHVGPLVSKKLIGQRVLPLRGEGTWQELVKAPEELIISIPNSFDDITAAQMYINPVTAWVTCTEVLSLRPDDVLLVNACGSSIGQIYAQLSRILDFRLIAVTRNNKYTEDLLKLGASYVINTNDEPLYETVIKLTNGNGAEAAIDLVGGSFGTNLAFCVRPMGKFISIGLLSGVQVSWADIANKAKVNADIFHLRHWNKRITAYKWQETFHHLIRLIDDQKLCLMTADSKYDLLDVKRAVDAVENSKRKKGKVFLTSY